VKKIKNMIDKNIINIEDHEFIASAETPKEARERGRNYELRENWDQIKENVMKIALSTKFSQHPQLKEILIESGDKVLGIIIGGQQQQEMVKIGSGFY